MHILSCNWFHYRIRTDLFDDIATVIEDGRIGERMALRLNLLEKKLLSKNYVFYLLFSRASFQVQENKDQRGYGYKYIVG